jgi:threonine synthase
MIVLETALPIKFAATIAEALGHEPERPARFEGIERCPSGHRDGRRCGRRQGLHRAHCA